jgi:hypothetical protein
MRNLWYGVSFDYLWPARQNAEFFSKQISFARTRSDAVVKRLDGNKFDDHKSKREERKSAPSLHQTVIEYSRSTYNLPESTRYTNPLKSKFRAKRLAAESQLFYIPRLINATTDLFPHF